MAFKNEKVLPLEQETSEFFRKAQKTLIVMYERRSTWTIDREREMALVHKGWSREDPNHDNWSFLDHKGKYSLSSDVLAESVISPEEIAITRSLSYMTSGDNVPDAETIACIKEALQENSRKFLFNLEHYKRCQLTLIDAITKKEI